MTGSRHVNQLVAIGVGIFSIFYLVVAFQIPQFAVGVTIQPGSFPKALGGLMLVLSVVMFWQRPAASDQDGGGAAAEGAAVDHPGDLPVAEDAPDVRQQPRTAGVRTDLLVTLGSMFGYVALLRPLGFPLVTALYLAAMTWYLGYRRHVVNAVVAVAVAGGLFAALGYGFGINLPTGPLPL